MMLLLEMLLDVAHAALEIDMGAIFAEYDYDYSYQIWKRTQMEASLLGGSVYAFYLAFLVAFAQRRFSGKVFMWTLVVMIIAGAIAFSESQSIFTENCWKKLTTKPVRTMWHVYIIDSNCTRSFLQRDHIEAMVLASVTAPVFLTLFGAVTQLVHDAQDQKRLLELK